MANQTPTSQYPQSGSPAIKAVVHVPFEQYAVAAFARAVANEGGKFELTPDGDLAIRYGDGRVVIFDGSSEIPAITTPELLEQFNDNPLSLIEAFGKFVTPKEVPEGDGYSVGHFASEIEPEITPQAGTDVRVPVGEDLPHLPGHLGEK